jgi:hypothetical protein
VTSSEVGLRSQLKGSVAVQQVRHAPLSSSIAARSESICGVIASEEVLLNISKFMPANIHNLFQINAVAINRFVFSDYPRVQVALSDHPPRNGDVAAHRLGFSVALGCS